MTLESLIKSIHLARTVKSEFPMQHFHFLLLVAQKEGITVKELVAALDSSPPSVCRAGTSLGQLGLISTTWEKKMKYYLTSKGRRFVRGLTE